MTDRRRPKQNNKDKLPSGVDTDRYMAYRTLVRVFGSQAFSNLALNAEAMDKVRNQAFVREIVYGVIKMRNRLDFYLSQLVRDGLGSVKLEILTLLETGVYQIMFMDTVPDHSAVDETVKIAKSEFHGKSGFVNGVLRNFLRKHDELAGPENIQDPAVRMNRMYSVDDSIIKLLSDQYGTQPCENMLRASVERPPLFINVNTLRTDIETLAEEIAGYADGYDKYLNLIKVKGHGILETEYFEKGLFFIQSEASSKAVSDFDPEPGETVLDVCAAPGGKSFAMAIRMKNEGKIYSFDLKANRLRLIEANKKRLGISIIESEVHDASDLIGEFVGSADKVLCDVPCSGLGMMARKPEIRYKDVSRLDRLYDLQYRILRTSSEYVRPGGRIMYSTCTVNKHENEEITERFLSEHDDFTVVESHVLLPGLDSGRTLDRILIGTGDAHKDQKQGFLDMADGFYYCIMERKRNS